jgi:hypothetical protein
MATDALKKTLYFSIFMKIFFDIYLKQKPHSQKEYFTNLISKTAA